MIFWRVLDDKLYAIDEVDKLGFEIEEGLRIPDEYLDNQEFVILRTCHGIGDWGIIASLPRLLKAKYPNCKVYVPSKNLIKKLFNIEHNNAHVVFDNNPYVDDFVDSVNGEIFHDHYRIYDKNNIDVPLAKQMLKFWQFTDFEMEDYLPEIYWTDEEKKLNLRNIDLRIQLYLKSKALVNISNQCGTNHIVARYSNCYESQRQYPIEHNYLKRIKYL